MADKYSFLVKHETEGIIKHLDDSQAGQLFRMLYNYSARNQINTEVDDVKVLMAFEFFKEFLDADCKKYEEKCKKRSEAAFLKWEKQRANDTSASK